MIWWQLRAKVLQRDDWTCQYCGRHEYTVGSTMHVDHIHPWSKGGRNWTENLVTACPDCNLKKAASLDPEWVWRLHEMQRRLADRDAAWEAWEHLADEIQGEAWRIDMYDEALMEYAA